MRYDDIAIWQIFYFSRNFRVCDGYQPSLILYTHELVPHRFRSTVVQTSEYKTSVYDILGVQILSSIL